MNDIFSAKNFFTEMNYYENQNEEDKNKKLLKLDVNTNFNDDYQITKSNFINNSSF